MIDPNIRVVEHELYVIKMYEYKLTMAFFATIAKNAVQIYKSDYCLTKDIAMKQVTTFLNAKN